MVTTLRCSRSRTQTPLDVTFFVGEEGIEEIAYEDTEAFQTMDLFIRDRDRLLERLLA